MGPRAVAHSSVVFVGLMLSFHAATAYAPPADFPDVSQAGLQPLRDADGSDRSAISPKTGANGVQIAGNFTYSILRGSVTLTLDKIQNSSTIRTTGTLRLELWAATTAPPRETPFTGYRLAVSTALSPLAPNAFHSGISRTATFIPPPDGTYWLVVVLAEFDSVNCPAADHYCITDTGVFTSQRTFGGSTSIQIGGSFSYQTSGSNVVIMVDRIESGSSTRTTGALRLELWATTAVPRRGTAFSGYQLAVTSTFLPLAPNTYYFDIVRNTTWLPPPDGTYWIVLVLSEFDLANCPAADHYCIVDSAVFPTRQTFGVATPTIVNVIEYYHAGFDHYFVTGIVDEINKLDTGYFAGWVRTGCQFKAYAIAGAPEGTSNVCRFFSTAFGIRSSHFYTPSASECATVKANPQWQFEAEVAAIASPAGAVPGNRTCPAGYIALYRLYNNGKDGAPNHRYTTSLAVFNQMRSIGWTFEGEANTFAFACVPP